MTHWVSDFLKNFQSFCDAYVAGPSTPLALPPPLAPRLPCTTATLTQWATPSTRAPSGHGNPRHPRTQWVTVPGAICPGKVGTEYAHPVGQWVNRKAGGIPENRGKSGTQWVRESPFSFDGDTFTFRAGKAKIRVLFKSTRILESLKPYPQNKRALCHH